jgi:hypothetical protein
VSSEASDEDELRRVCAGAIKSACCLVDMWTEKMPASDHAEIGIYQAYGVPKLRHLMRRARDGIERQCGSCILTIVVGNCAIDRVVRSSRSER